MSRLTKRNAAPGYGGSRTVDFLVVIMSAVFFTNMLISTAPQAEERVYAYPMVIAE